MHKPLSYTHSVLLIQGEQSQFDELGLILEGEGLAIWREVDLPSAMHYVRLHRPPLILMDLMIGDKDAIDLLKDLNGENLLRGAMAVVISERTERYVEIAALEAGADDYLVKPVNNLVFSSRLRSWTRRLNGALIQASETQKQAFHLDRDHYSILLPDGEVQLQRKEFEIISLLSSRPKKIFTRGEIKEKVWGNSLKTKVRTIDVHITNLRSKVGEEIIKTHKGLGYSFDI